MAVRPNKPEWRRNYFKTEPPPKPGKLPPRAVTPPVEKADSVKKAKRLVLEKPFAALCKDAGVKASVAQARRYLGGTGTAYAFDYIQTSEALSAATHAVRLAEDAARSACHDLDGLRDSAKTAEDTAAADAAVAKCREFSDARVKELAAAQAAFAKVRSALDVLEARRVAKRPALRAA